MSRFTCSCLDFIDNHKCCHGWLTISNQHFSFNDFKSLHRYQVGSKHVKGSPLPHMQHVLKYSISKHIKEGGHWVSKGGEGER